MAGQTMEPRPSWRHSYYKSHNDWEFDGNRNSTNRGIRSPPMSSSSYMYNQPQPSQLQPQQPPQKQQQKQKQQQQQYDDQLYQTKYPDEWKNFKLKDVKRMKSKTRSVRDRSAVSPIVKHFLFTINILFLVAGVAITSLSVYVLVESDDENETDIRCFMDFIFSPICLLCTLGGLIVLPAFLGCYGALRENTCVIKMYYILALFLLLIEIILVTGVFVFTLVPDALSNIGLYPQDFLDDAILRYGDRLHTEDGCGRDGDDFVDFIQDKFSCCGSSNDDEGYLDWLENPYYGCNNTTPQACSVPISCCKADTTTFDCAANKLDPSTTDLSEIYIRGCEKGMREVFEDNILLIGFFSFAVILVQIFFTCCAMRLNSQVMEQRSKW